jgi:hypothetical protein
MVSQEEFIKDLDIVLNDIRSLLIEKNRKYGDAALSPVRMMSKSSPSEQIKVRIDDKLSRIANQQTDEDEDVAQDLTGYLVLLFISKLRESRL